MKIPNRKYLWAAALMFGLGCGGGGDTSSVAPGVPETAAEAATVIQREFAAAPPATQQNAQVVTEAFQSGQYDQAAAALAALETQAQTKEQKWAVYNSKIRLQMELAIAMQNGDDASAQEAVRMLQRESSGGR